MPADFHDYHLTGYNVDCEKQEIRLRTRGGRDKDAPCTEIAFQGVAAYHFEYDNFGTILGWIHEQPLREFLEQRVEQFALGWKKSGWPPFWRGSAPMWQGSVDDAFSKLQADS